MLLNDVYMVTISLQEIKVVIDKSNVVLYEGLLIDITNRNKHLLDCIVAFLECEKDIMYIYLDM